MENSIFGAREWPIHYTDIIIIKIDNFRVCCLLLYIYIYIFVNEESPIHSQFITTCFIRIAPQSSDKHVDRNTGATSSANQFCRTGMKKLGISECLSLSLHR